MSGEEKEILKSLRDVHLELSSVCNLHCMMCPVPSRQPRYKRFLTLLDVYSITNLNPEVKFIGLSNWGEPLLNPSLKEIIMFLADVHGKNVYLATNGTLLDQAYMKLFCRYLMQVTVSVDGVHDVYSKIRGFPYEKLERKLLKLIETRNQMKSKTKIYVNFTVSELNVDYLEDFKSHAETWKADKILFQPALTFRHKTRDRGGCQQLNDKHAVVLSDGAVVPCCVDYLGHLNVGNALTTPLKEVWNGDKIQELRRDNKDTFCDYCSEYENPYIKNRF